MQERTALEDQLTSIGRIEQELEDNIGMIELGEAEKDQEVVTDAENALRALLVVPEVGVFGLTVELVEALARLVEVKDASSAARPTA